MLADALTAIGLILTAFGAGIAARSVILKEDDAIHIGVARWAGETREEDLALPTVQNLLRSSRSARLGLWMVVAGTVLQVMPIAARLAQPML